jgi:hypothetical protein
MDMKRNSRKNTPKKSRKKQGKYPKNFKTHD